MAKITFGRGLIPGRGQFLRKRLGKPVNVDRRSNGKLNKGYIAYLKRNFPRMLEKRREKNPRPKDGTELKLKGQSLLDQENIVVTPIIRYWNYCSCGDAWLSDKQEPRCRRYPLCQSIMISYTMETDSSVKG